MFFLLRPLRASQARCARVASRFAFRSQVSSRRTRFGAALGRARRVGRGGEALSVRIVPGSSNRQDAAR